MRRTLVSFVEDCFGRGDETAIVFRRGARTFRWTHAHLAATAYQFARELQSRGINKGERIIIQGEGGPEWVAAFYGCLLTGVVAVPLDRHSTPDFVQRVHQQVDCKLLIGNRSEATDFVPAGQTLNLDELSDVVSHHSTAPMDGGNIKPDDLIEIIFTSGTTASPRGVCLTHANLLANLGPLEKKMQEYSRWERLAHPVRFLSLLPLSHVFGQFMGIFVPQLLGGEVYFQESLRPSDIIDTVRRNRITVLVAFPRLLETLQDKLQRDIDAEDRRVSFDRDFSRAEGLSFLRRALIFRRIHRRFGWKFWAFVSGGATLNKDTEAFWRRLGFAVVHGYGMTETASIISMPNPFQQVEGSIGRVLAGQEVRVDDNGEILIRGANIANGYWNGKDGVTPMTGSEGWLHTGDIGEFDRQGNLFFRGREKDVIVTAAGLNIHPEDLEAALDRQPGVHASCVVGVGRGQGPEPLAVLILSGEHSTAAEIVRQANETLAPFQRMRRWVIWPDSDFPRTAGSGKIIRRLVVDAAKNLETAVQGSRAAEVRGPSSFILQEASRISGENVGEASTRATLGDDLKLDSLGRVTLLSALEERYQVELDEAAFTPAATLGDVEKMIRGEAQDAAKYPFPDWPHSLPVRWLRLIVYYCVVLPLTRLMCWVRVEGREHERNLPGNVLLVSNHVSMVDPALILSALSPQRRHRLAIAMLGEFLREWRYAATGNQWWRRVIMRAKYILVVALFNVFPLPQLSGFRRSFMFAGRIMDRGSSILVFPEGHRTIEDRVNPFMRGTGLLVKALNVPVIPVSIKGLFELRERGKRFVRPGTVTVKFGKPVKFGEEMDPVEITRTLESMVAGL